MRAEDCRRSSEVYLDIETEHWSDEVEGGWRNIPGFGMAMAVTFDGPPPGLTCWGRWGAPGGNRGDPIAEAHRRAAEVAQALIRHLRAFDRIITFNGERFDFKVLSAYGDVSGLYARSLDVLAIAQKQLGHRVSLDSFARATLGRGKSDTARQAVNWLREGTSRGYHQAVCYCIGDVMLLRELVDYGRRHSHLMYFDRDGEKRSMPYHEPPAAAGMAEVSMKRLILTVGLPRSGKSSWAREQGHPIVSRDAIRLALHGQDYVEEMEPKVTEIEDCMVKALLIEGHEAVIIDACHATAKRRQRWIDMAQENGWKLEYRHFTASKEECIARAIETGHENLIPVIERMAAGADFLPMGGAGELPQECNTLTTRSF